MSRADDLRQQDASGTPDSLLRKPPKSRQGASALRHAAPDIKSGSEVFEFGTFRLFPYQRLLFDGPEPVQIGSRAFDMLTALLRQPGALVTKEELIAQIWPNTVVDESNLKVHMAALRKALRDSDRNNPLIGTISGEGYRFAAPVLHTQEAPKPAQISDAATVSATRPAIELPVPRTPMFGRSEFVSALIAHLRDCRAITVVGPGGIGKTRVVAATAELLAETYSHRIHFIDLTAVADPARVVSAVADALGVKLRSENPIAELLGFLGGKRTLIVIDNCERVVDTTADLIERLSTNTPGLNILATSREPLRYAGEWVRHLPPLRFPEAAEHVTAESAMTYPSVQLFTDRAHTADGVFAVTDSNAQLVAEICRQLDGIPLSIELAASQVEALGLEGLVTQLERAFRLQMSGLRTAHARHQNLSALQDWSYDTLTDSERTALRRLAIFPGQFTLEEACAVIADSGSGRPRDLEDIASLITKSLVATDFSGDVALYRLLRTTRIYAHDKLVASGELEQMGQRHAALAKRATSIPSSHGQAAARA